MPGLAIVFLKSCFLHGLFIKNSKKLAKFEHLSFCVLFLFPAHDCINVIWLSIFQINWVLSNCWFSKFAQGELRWISPERTDSRLDTAHRLRYSSGSLIEIRPGWPKDIAVCCQQVAGLWSSRLICASAISVNLVWFVYSRTRSTHGFDFNLSGCHFSFFKQNKWAADLVPSNCLLTRCYADAHKWSWYGANCSWILKCIWVFSWKGGTLSVKVGVKYRLLYTWIFYIFSSLFWNLYMQVEQ
jgi:hypothetical protein